MATCISISSNLESVPTTPHALSLSPPLPVHHPQTHAALVRGDENAADQHSHRVERQAVRVLGGGRAPRIDQEADGGGRKWVAMLNYGAYKHRAATNPGSISIKIVRCEFLPNSFFRSRISSDLTVSLGCIDF